MAERGLVVFGVLFLVIPLLLALGVTVVGGGTAFGLTVALIALLTLGFVWGIVFLDLGEGQA